MKTFENLTEKEILALAISLEEEDERVYADFADGLKEEYPASASVFAAMRTEESGHRRRLIELYQQKFGEHIPLIRRQDLKRLRTKKTGLAGPASGAGYGAAAGQRHRSGDAAVL